MFKMIKQNLGGVDVCVNNAGMANAAPLLSGETKDWREMIDVSLNVHANQLKIKRAFDLRKKYIVEI